MNFYVELINETINYIEDNITERLELHDISERFNISHFHFNRMFKTVTGTTLKQYILGRKLTYALEKLKLTRASVIDIAFETGFEYPETFSRAFKKQFGVSPAVCRSEGLTISGVKKACIIERDIANYQGQLAVKANCVYLESIDLRGEFAEVDINSDEFCEILRASSNSFLYNSRAQNFLLQDRLFTVVNCHGNDDGKYTVFNGKQALDNKIDSVFKQRIVPEGWYAKFIYHGDMFDIRETFSDDLYRWIMVKEMQLNPNGVGMLSVFKEDYIDTQCIEIFVPIKNPE